MSSVVARTGQPPVHPPLPAPGERQVGRFDRTLAEEWAHVQVFASGQQRADTLSEFLRRCDYGRAHTAPGGEHLSAESTTSQGSTPVLVHQVPLADEQPERFPERVEADA